MSGPARRQDLLGILEGYYLTGVIEALHRSGALIALQAGTAVEAVARAQVLDPVLLQALLHYLQARTVRIVPDASAAGVPPDATFSGHLLDQYKGAFGPCVDRLDDILRDPGLGATLVDWERHRLAFGAASRGACNAFALQLLAELQVDCVVDLGCSAGGLLLDFAHANPEARAWGIDSNHAAIAQASRLADAEKVSDRTWFRVASAERPVAAMSPGERAQVQVVLAFNLANAFFDSRDVGRFPAWLTGVRAAFPDSLLLLGDYYGRLGTCPAQDSHRYRRAMMHDVAQALTAQGIPPVDSSGWRMLLEASGATVVKAFEGEHGEVAHFVYLVQL